MAYALHMQHNGTLRSPPPTTSAAASTTSMIDGTWEICVYIDALGPKKIRVRGDLHIGGLMLKIVEGLENDRDWSDFAIWWPKKNNWLKKMRSTLDQCNIQACTVLHFLPAHGHLYVQLPDLQILQMRIDFSVDVFSVVIKMCRDLGIRHPEELSLSLPLENGDLKRNQGFSMTPRSKSHHDVLTSDPEGRAISRDSLSSFASSPFNRASNQSLASGGNSSSSFLRDSFYANRSSGRFSLRRKKSRNSLVRTGSTPLSPAFADGTLSRNFDANSISALTPRSASSLLLSHGQDLENSPWISSREAFDVLLRPKIIAEKARCNVGWLDSSKSLMEQSVHPSSLVLLKFKFYAFYDLNPMYDSVRINQLYEQAKWSILLEELECTKEEMVAFAALQLHILQLQGQTSQQHSDSSSTLIAKVAEYDFCRTPEDLIDAALNDLQMSLEGSTLDFPTPFSARTRCSTNSRTSSGSSCNPSYRSNYPNGFPSTSSAYTISSSSSSPFYPNPSSTSRYDFNSSGIFGIAAAPPTQDGDSPVPPSLVQDITRVPELSGHLRFYRPKRFFLKSFKKQRFHFKDLILSMFRTPNDEKAIWSLNLKGCDVTSEVLVAANKYIIKLVVPLVRGTDEIWFKMDDEEQYVVWFAGLKLACGGRTMADVPAFTEEVLNIRGKLSMLRGGKIEQGSAGTKLPSNGDHDYEHIDDRARGASRRSPPPPPLNRKDSGRRSLFSRGKSQKDLESSNPDRINGVGRDNSILRSRVKHSQSYSGINGWHREGPLHQTNGRRDSNGDPFDRHQMGSSSSSLASIPKSLKGSKCSLFGNLAPQDFLAQKFCRRTRLKQVLHNVSEAIEGMQDLQLLDSKLAYIKAWQSLPDFGNSYFVIRLKDSKKEDILVLSPSKVVLLDGSSSETVKRWRYQDLQSWSVNWQIKQVVVSFDDEKMTFRCQTSDCKVLHEFIGGYIFLHMRSPDRNHKLNQELFHKLTGGWT